MRFFMLSDFHLREECNSEMEERIKRVCSKIRSEIDIREMLLFVLMGDLIDRGNGNAFGTVDKMLTLIRGELSNYEISFEAIPGNHDLVDKSLDAFSTCAAAHGMSMIKENYPVYARQYGEINFIFADSTLTRDYNDPGKLDLEEIRKVVLPGKCNLLFTHHGFTQSHGDRHNVVDDGGTVLRELGRMGINFAFHAHTHRADGGSRLEQIIEIGCGSFSGDLKGMSGITHQFTMGGVDAAGAVFVERWADAKDGYGSFLYGSLYPEERMFTDPSTVGKINYSPEEQYLIQRRIVPHEVSMQDPITRYWQGEKGCDLLEIFPEYNVLLLSDAGQGKSVLLRHLASSLGKLFPFLFSLKNYTGESIEELLPERYRGLAPSLMALLFDGYDELTGDMVQRFEAQLSQYMTKKPGLHVILSSRSNFCKTEQNNQSKTFPGFQVYDLCPLEYKDITGYLVEQGIDQDAFYAAARVGCVTELCKNPFYLIRLASLYSDDQKLPSKTGLMDRLVEDSFEWDDEKFPGKLEEIYTEMFRSLERVAFAMQLLGKNQLDDRKEFQRIFAYPERHRVKKSGLFQREGVKWGFIHNNFREYLVARHLCSLSKEEVIRLILSGTEIKPTWVNALGYLMNLEVNWDLKGWLFKYIPNALVKFEPDRLDWQDRQDVFTRMFSYYEKHQIRFQDPLCTEEELACFACSPWTLEFLLGRIAEPVNVMSQNNALRLLRYFPKLYGKQQQVRETLLNVCGQYPNVPAALCRLAIIVLMEQRLSSHDVTERLMDLYGQEENDYIRWGLYEYLLETKEQDRYVQFFLDGLPLVLEQTSQGNRISDEQFVLLDGLGCMEAPDSVAKVFAWLTKYVVRSTHLWERMVDHLCLQAEFLYRKGAAEIFPAVLDFCVAAYQRGQWNQAKQGLEFFRKIERMEDVVLALADLGRPGYLELLRVMDSVPEAFDYIEQAYLDGRLRDPGLLAELALSYIRDQQQYERYRSLILEREGKQLPEWQPPRNYGAEQKQARQQYFELLFDSRVAQKWIERLIERSSYESPTVEQIADENLKIEISSPLLMLKYTMQRYVSGNTKVSNFCTTVCWDRFLLIEVQEKICQEKIVPTVEQKAQLEDRIRSVIEPCIEKEPDSELTLAAVALSVRFGIEHQEKILLDMTRLYDFFFAEEKGNNQKYQYLECYLTQEQLRMQLVKNINIGGLHPRVVCDHLDYCNRHQWDDLLPEATELCRSAETDLLLRSCALKYVYQQAGEDYVSQELIPCADGEFLIEIEKTCGKISRKVLRDAMELQFARGFDMRLLAHLLVLQSGMALNAYTELVTRENRVPMGNFGEDATAAIGTLKDPAFLPQMEGLLRAMFTEGFQDGSFHTLSGSLAKAFVSCGALDPLMAKEILTQQIQTSRGIERCVRWCNQVLEYLKGEILRQEEHPRELNEVIEIMRQMEKGPIPNSV
jgi:hypothetical protein